jgi:hypothetical protein
MKKMSVGSWTIIAVLAFFLAWSALISIREWMLLQNVQMPPYGYAAMILGILFSLIVGVGLMALVFYSSRYNYDEPPKILSNDDDRSSS